MSQVTKCFICDSWTVILVHRRGGDYPDMYFMILSCLQVTVSDCETCASRLKSTFNPINLWGHKAIKKLLTNALENAQIPIWLSNQNALKAVSLECPTSPNMGIAWYGYALPNMGIMVQHICITVHTKWVTAKLGARPSGPGLRGNERFAHRRVKTSDLAIHIRHFCRTTTVSEQPNQQSCDFCNTTTASKQMIGKLLFTRPTILRPLKHNNSRRLTKRKTSLL